MASGIVHTYDDADFDEDDDDEDVAIIIGPILNHYNYFFG